MDANARIYVAGHRGLVGSALVRCLQAKGYSNLITRGHAELANAYVDELYKLTKVLAVTEASQRRLFFERQLAQAKDNLAKAEASAKQALENGGLVQVERKGREGRPGVARRDRRNQWRCY